MVPEHKSAELLSTCDTFCAIFTITVSTAILITILNLFIGCMVMDNELLALSLSVHGSSLLDRLGAEQQMTPDDVQLIKTSFHVPSSAELRFVKSSLCPTHPKCRSASADNAFCLPAA